MVADYDYDLIIVGAGPAGSIMALSAARHGLEVLLIDKAVFPRDKICGDAIPMDARPLLEAYGLSDAVRDVPHELVSRLSVVGADQCLNVATPPAGMLMCPRVHFDNVLFQAAKSVVDTCEGARVTGLLTRAVAAGERTVTAQRSGDGHERRSERQISGVELATRTGQRRRYASKIVAGADGCHSFVARSAGVYRRTSAHRGVATRGYYRGVSLGARNFEIHYFEDARPGYFWIFPVGCDADGSPLVNVGVGMFADARPLGLSVRDLHVRLLRSPRLRTQFTQAEQIGAIKGWHLPLASRRRPMHGHGFILAGDAAGLIDPLWGHGIDSAMISGDIAGEILAQVCRGDNYRAEVLQVYADAVWERLGAEFTRGHHARTACFEDQISPSERDAPDDSRLARLNLHYFGGQGVLSTVQ